MSIKDWIEPSEFGEIVVSATSLGYCTRMCAGLLTGSLMFVPMASGQSQTAAVTFDSRQTVLLFMQPDEAAYELSRFRPSLADPNSSAERAVVQECSRGRRSDGTTSKGFLGSLQKPIVNFLLAQVTDRVRRELAEYSSVFSQSIATDFYSGQPETRSLQQGALDTQSSCFRFSQGDLGHAGVMDLAFDLVVSVRIADSRDAVILKPLRLYLGQTSAKSADGSLGVAVAVRADGVWRDMTRGIKDDIWDEVILVTAADLSRGPVLMYEPELTQPDVRLPLPPVSFGVDSSRPFGRIDVTVTAAQAGTLPTSLELLGDILLPSKDQKARLLYLAADARARLAKP
jgi:hypothetical protein